MMARSLSEILQNKFYGILQDSSKNVTELNARKCCLSAILEFLEESGSLEMVMWCPTLPAPDPIPQRSGAPANYVTAWCQMQVRKR